MAYRDRPVVNFLEVDENYLQRSEIPNCFHFASSQIVVKSPKIPVVVKGIRVPMIVEHFTEICFILLERLQQ